MSKLGNYIGRFGAWGDYRVFGLERTRQYHLPQGEKDYSSIVALSTLSGLVLPEGYNARHFFAAPRARLAAKSLYRFFKEAEELEQLPHLPTEGPGGSSSYNVRDGLTISRSVLEANLWANDGAISEITYISSNPNEREVMALYRGGDGDRELSNAIKQVSAVLVAGGRFGDWIVMTVDHPRDSDVNPILRGVKDYHENIGVEELLARGSSDSATL